MPGEKIKKSSLSGCKGEEPLLKPLQWFCVRFPQTFSSNTVLLDGGHVCSLVTKYDLNI